MSAGRRGTTTVSSDGRANDGAAQRIKQHFAWMRGALERYEAGARTAETPAMVEEGTALVARP